MLQTLLIIIIILTILSSLVTSEESNKDHDSDTANHNIDTSINTNDNKNYFIRAEEETRKNLNSVHSRDQLNHFMKMNLINPEKYKDYSIDTCKERICRLSRMRGKAYKDYF